MKILNWFLCLFLGYFANQAIADSHAESPTPKSQDTESIDRCTLNGFTDSCKAFSKDGPLILPGGLPNYAALLNDSSKEADKFDRFEGTMRGEQLEGLKDREKVEEILARASDRLKDTKGKGFSRIFSIFASNPSALANLLGLSSDKKKPSVEIDTVWPPDSDEADFKSVPRTEIQESLSQLFTDEEKKEISALAEKKMGVPGRIIGSLNKEETNAALKKLNTVTPEREKEVSGLVEFAKNQIINLISKGESDAGKLSKAQQNAIAKVKSIKFKGLDKTVESNMACIGPIPNAFYSAMDHSFTICPQLFNFPNESLMGVIAHEIGHSVDPCLSQFGTYKIEKDRIQATLEPGGKIPREIAEDDKRFRAFSLLQQIDGLGADTTAAPMPFYCGEAELAYLKEKGLISSQIPESPFDEYIFSSVYACLKSPEGGGFRATDADFITKMSEEVSKTLERQAKNAGVPYDAQKDKEKIVSAFSKYPECLSPDKHSQMGEAVADWIGAKVTGQYLKGRNLDSTEKKILPVGFFASLACMERDSKHKQLDTESETMGETIGRVFQSLARMTDPHPETETRIHEIFLRDTNIRDALGCEKSDKQSCS